MSKRIVTHLGIEYEVPEKFIESIEKNGVIFNNEYISYLFLLQKCFQPEYYIYLCRRD
jgi:hypothetical protein